jgi:hypothetical protein
MADPLEYLAQAQDCLCKAADAPTAEARDRWLDLAESWLAMVPQDLRTLEKLFQRAVPDQGLHRQTSRTRH